MQICVGFSATVSPRSFDRIGVALAGQQSIIVAVTAPAQEGMMINETGQRKYPRVKPALRLDPHAFRLFFPSGRWLGVDSTWISVCFFP